MKNTLTTKGVTEVQVNEAWTKMMAINWRHVFNSLAQVKFKQ